MSRLARTLGADDGSEDSSLVTLLRARERDLVRTALAAGLAEERPRSSPRRLHDEAHAFLRLLEVSLATPEQFESAVAGESFDGVFAMATPAAGRRIVSLWRRVAHSLPAGSRRALAASFDRIQGAAIAACRARPPDRKDIVVLGGSAGAIQAIGGILSVMGSEVPATFLVVIHRGRTLDSHLPEVLSRYTRLPVLHARDGDPLHLGCVLVAPPDRHLVVLSDHVRIMDGPDINYARPSIDVLFSSAARSCSSRVLAVLVTGNGRDGTSGVRVVHQLGGKTCAADPATADFGTMPATAIATGAIDVIAEPRALRSHVRRLISREAA